MLHLPTATTSRCRLATLCCCATARTSATYWPIRTTKLKRVVRRITGEDAHSFSDDFDAAYIIMHDFERIYRRRFPLTMLTDAEPMSRVVT